MITANHARPPAGTTMPDWAAGQLALRATFEDWVAGEIDRYQAAGFAALYGGRHGHALDEAGGWTRSFASAFCLNGDRRIADFLKRFRDDWHRAVKAAGHFHHGYDANESGDYVTHTAEAFTQFILNVLYLDIGDEKSVAMVEDAAEHLGNWHPDVQPWYDWERHYFLSYFLGTRSPYHRPPFDFQSTRHFRLLTVASAAHEATGRRRYLDLCLDYWSGWSRRLLETPPGRPLPMEFKLIDDGEIARWAARPEIMSDWHFHRYYAAELARLGLRPLPPPKSRLPKPHHLSHDMVMTMLDVARFAPEHPGLRPGLRRVMEWWLSLPEDRPSQLTASDPHCGIHLPKYRDITGDRTLESTYLSQWSTGPGAFLLDGDPRRLVGAAEQADAAFRQALARNRGDFGPEHVVNHACDKLSNAGTSSAWIMPTLFMPALGGLGIHFGRAPWLNVLYYSEGRLGLPADVAALWFPPAAGRPARVRLFNAGDRSRTVSARGLDPARTTRLVPGDAPAAGLPEMTLAPGAEDELDLPGNR